jgi:Fe2+ or Zn2+ uptake regulation protein
MGTLENLAARKLRQQGGRMTAQRRLILSVLEGMPGDHPTAEEVHTRARAVDPNLHLSTVYRTLRWLQAEGLVSSRWFPEERRHERFDHNRPAEHHHFVCLACQGVVEFVEPLMMDSICKQFEDRSGASVESAALVLYGQCPNCRQTSASETETADLAHERSVQP